MSSLYGAVSFTPSAGEVRNREKKVRAAIAYLGDKYLLAKPVEKLHGTVAKTIR